MSRRNYVSGVLATLIAAFYIGSKQNNIAAKQNEINESLLNLNFLPSLAIKYENGKFLLTNYGKVSIYIDTIRIPNYRFVDPIQKTIFTETSEDISNGVNNYVSEIQDQTLSLLEFTAVIQTPNGNKNFIGTVFISWKIKGGKIIQVTHVGQLNFSPLNGTLTEYIQAVSQTTSSNQ